MVKAKTNRINTTLFILSVLFDHRTLEIQKGLLVKLNFKVLTSVKSTKIVS